MKDKQPEPQRHEIVEQAGSPTVRFVIDEHSFILPYAFFVRAECHVREDRYLIAAYWTTMTVTIQGQNLEKLSQLLAEYRLTSLLLRSEIEQSAPNNEPYIEHILVALREQPSIRAKGRRNTNRPLMESAGHP